MSVGTGGGTGGNTLRISTNTNNFKIYPNPAKDIINLELEDNNNVENNKIILAELFDLFGESKQKIEIINNKSTFSVSRLNKGMYILKIYINDQVETHQIVVE